MNSKTIEVSRVFQFSINSHFHYNNNMKCIKCDYCNVCSTIVSQFIPHNFCIVSYFQADTENCHKSMIFIDTLIYIDHNQANAELFGFLRIYLQLKCTTALVECDCFAVCLAIHFFHSVQHDKFIFNYHSGRDVDQILRN